MIEEENIQSSDDLIDEDDDVLESRLQQLATEELNQTVEGDAEPSQSPTDSNETKPESGRASAASAATLEKINGLIEKICLKRS